MPLPQLEDTAGDMHVESATPHLNHSKSTLQNGLGDDQLESIPPVGLARTGSGTMIGRLPPSIAGELQKSHGIDLFHPTTRHSQSKTPQALIGPLHSDLVEKLAQHQFVNSQSSPARNIHNDWLQVDSRSFRELPYLATGEPPAQDNLKVDSYVVEKYQTPARPFEHSISSSRMFRCRLAYGLSLHEAIQLAVNNSPELVVLNADVIINQNEIIRQDASFDFSQFVETLYDQQSNPVGNNLDGAQGTLRNKLWNLETGIRKRTRTGGQLSLAQRFGHLESNSIFINPNNQATGNFGVEIQQPLARGSSRIVNESGIELARIATLSSRAELRAGIQEQLLTVISAYWDLILKRGNLSQLSESLQRAEEILRVMENRQSVDVLPQQLVRARAAVARRKAATAQARFQAMLAQENLLRQIFGSQYQFNESFEVLPTNVVPGQLAICDLQSGIRFGIQNRPEIQIAMQDIHSAAVQQRIAINELSPQLDLIFSVFGKGLRGRSSFSGAFADQFASGEPSFQIGLNYELPYRNRAARANATQREIAVAKLQSQLQTVVNDVTLDIREQDIARAQYSETLAIRRQAMDLARQELQTLETRRKLLLDGDQIANLYLDDLIQAQERLQQSELEYLQTITGFGITQANWLKAIGALDQYNLSVRPTF